MGKEQGFKKVELVYYCPRVLIAIMVINKTKPDLHLMGTNHGITLSNYGGRGGRGEVARSWLEGGGWRKNTQSVCERRSADVCVCRGVSILSRGTLIASA